MGFYALFLYQECGNECRHSETYKMDACFYPRGFSMSNLALVTFPTAQEFQTMKEIGLHAIRSGLIPSAINTPEKALIIIMKGRELGIPPMLALAKISVINGKPAIDGELMLALIYSRVPGAEINFLVNDDKRCEIEARRPGGKFSKFVFTIEDGERAGLLNKESWRKYPGDMIKWRAVSKMARSQFADAISGMSHTPEELGAEVDDEGRVVSEPTVEPPRDAEPKPIETAAIPPSLVAENPQAPQPTASRLWPEGGRDPRSVPVNVGFLKKHGTVGKALEEEGLATLQKSAWHFLEKQKVPRNATPEQIEEACGRMYPDTSMFVRAVMELARRGQEQPVFPGDLTEDEERMIERHIQESKFSHSIVSEFDADGTRRGK